MITLEEAKSWLRIDYDDDDTDIEMLIDSAKEYIKNATNPNINTESKLFNLAMRMLIQHWYDNRSAVLIGSISKSLELSLNSILIQINNDVIQI